MTEHANTAWIDARSRNLGVGWTTAATSDSRGYHYEPAGAPPSSERGGSAAVRRARSRIRQVYGTSTYYRADLYVGDRRVTAFRVRESDRWQPADHLTMPELISHVASGFTDLYDARRIQVQLADPE